MRKLLANAVIVTCMLIVQANAGGHGTIDSNDQILSLIGEWFGGVYTNKAQIETDEANNVSQDKRHMPLHQIIKPVALDAFDGLTFFQQTSSDGTAETVAGVGIFHFTNDEASGRAMLRLRLFKERDVFINAHLDVSKLAGVTLEDLYWNEGCEFYLSLIEDGAAVKGEMKEDTCYPVMRSTGQKIKHEDETIIRPAELWNNGRFYDLDGNFLFGNRTGEFQKQIRIDG